MANIPVYTERNLLAIAFCKLALKLGWKAGIRKDTEHKEWENDWKNVVVVELPCGEEVAWHISPEEISFIKSLPQYTKKWNGNSFAKNINWVNSID